MPSINPINPQITNYETPLNVSGTGSASTSYKVLVGINNLRNGLEIRNLDSTPARVLILSYRDSLLDSTQELAVRVEVGESVKFTGRGEFQIKSGADTPSYLAIEY